jgi:hypothetical protein
MVPLAYYCTSPPSFQMFKLEPLPVVNGLRDSQHSMTPAEHQRLSIGSYRFKCGLFGELTKLEHDTMTV